MNQVLDAKLGSPGRRRRNDVAIAVYTAQDVRSGAASGDAADIFFARWQLTR
jgi:hypothetical protein